MAGRLSPDRSAWVLFLLRGVHPHHRLDVQPACEVAEGLQSYSLEETDRLTQLFAEFPCLAARSQWVQPSGSGIYRSCHQQESRGGARLSPTRCQYAVVCDRSLPAEPQLCKRRCCGETAGAP